MHLGKLRFIFKIKVIFNFNFSIIVFIRTPCYADYYLCSGGRLCSNWLPLLIKVAFSASMSDHFIDDSNSSTSASWRAWSTPLLFVVPVQFCNADSFSPPCLQPLNVRSWLKTPFPFNFCVITELLIDLGSVVVAFTMLYVVPKIMRQTAIQCKKWVNKGK